MAGNKAFLDFDTVDLGTGDFVLISKAGAVKKTTANQFLETGDVGEQSFSNIQITDQPTGQPLMLREDQRIIPVDSFSVNNTTKDITLNQSLFVGESVVAGNSSGNSSAILQGDSTTKGFLPPRMTSAQDRKSVV